MSVVPCSAAVALNQHAWLAFAAYSRGQVLEVKLGLVAAAPVKKHLVPRFSFRC